jgi:outer membrane protein assembly factor BamB
LIWSYPTEGQVISSPEISGGNVYAGSTDGKLYAINANTGTLAWSYNLGDPIVATPCIVPSVSGSHAGITAKGFNGKVAEVLDDGTEQWNKTLSKTGGWSSPTYNPYLYVATAADETGKSSVYA